jgi:hypothetical protein
VPVLCETLSISESAPSMIRKAPMENYRSDELRAELDHLLNKQAEVLQSRTLMYRKFKNSFL